MAFSHPQHNSTNAKKLRSKAGAYLKGLRIAADLTQKELAERSGLNWFTMVGQIESGKVRLPPEKYVSMARALNVEPSELVKKVLPFYDPFTFSALFISNPSEIPPSLRNLPEDKTPQRRGPQDQAESTEDEAPTS